MTSRDLRRLTWRLEGTGVAVMVAPTFAGLAGPRLDVRPVAGLPLLYVDNAALGLARHADEPSDTVVATAGSNGSSDTALTTTVMPSSNGSSPQPATPAAAPAPSAPQASPARSNGAPTA
jgi:hypothetical protein